MVWAEAMAASSTTRTNSSASSNSNRFARLLLSEVLSTVWVAITPSSFGRRLSRAATRMQRIARGCLCSCFSCAFVTNFLGAPFASKRADPSNVFAQNQRVNIVCAFVSLDRFQVHHVAHDGIIVGDAVAAENIAGHTRALQRHPHIVALDHGDVLMTNPAGVFQPADLQGQKLRLGDLADHPDELLLDQLVRCNGLVTELLANLGLLQRRVI